MAIDLKPDLEEAIKFLRHWSDAPILSASHTDGVTGAKGAFETRQFKAPVNWDQVRVWISARQREGNWCNIYFSVNTAKGDVDSKLGRADLGQLVALHVDVDVRTGEEQQAGIERIVKTFQSYKHPPSDIITSGGGAQAFWRLKNPVPINGDLAIAEDLKQYNRQIEKDLAGDHCHSLDHVMRVPHTVNVPNDKKLAKGRVPMVARWYSTSAVAYDLADFEKAPPEEPPAERDTPGFRDTGSYERVLPTDERLRKVDAKWIKIGVDGDTEGKWLDAGGQTDRSRMALAFVTALKRAGVEDQCIASVLMDPAWKVGACIRDKGGETKRHLKRIIERGGKFVDEDLAKPAVLGKDTWTKSANQFMVRCYPDGLVHWRSDFFPYRDGVYLPTEEDTMRSVMRKWLNESLVAQPPKKDSTEFTFAPFNPNNSDVNELYNTVKDMCHIDRDAMEQPCWLVGQEDRPPPRECINCRNGILHVPTRTLIGHTPDFFTSNIAEFSYDPQAQCPLWLSTINEYWPTLETEAAPQEPFLLQEMIGYSLLPWTDLQKLLAVVGPGRSGKGTIGRVITMLVGEANTAAPNFGSLSGDFGAMQLLHKTVAIVGEASFGRRDDRAGVTNFLKTVSGEDKVSVNRKNKDFWVGRLLVRFWLFCNKIPDFEDAGKALMMRMVPLKMTRSFAENPDTKLTAKLALEIAGILNWALAGYDRLRANAGMFTMPQSSLDTQEVFGRMASPLLAFLEEYCAMEPAAFVTEADLHAAYEEWCDKVSTRPKQQGKFIEDIVSLEPAKFRRVRKGLHEEADRPRGLTGLKLKKPAPVKQGRGKGRNDENPEIPF